MAAPAKTKRRLAMRSTFLALVMTIGFAGVSVAEDKPAAPAADKPAAPAAPATAAPKGKPVTLSGTMVCGKCALNETEKCQNVLKVTKAGKEEKYYLAANDVAEKNHEKVCSEEHKATVKGTVAEEAGKKVLTASSIKYK
jgi:hypothetical protein